MVKIPYHIENLWPYKAGKPISELVREKGLTRVVKLASNENPNGPSPKALEAIKGALGQAHLYVDPSAFELVQAIAKRFNKRPSQIVCGHGTDALLEYMIMAFTDTGDEVLTSMGTFIGVYVNTNKLGRTLVQLPMQSYSFDLESIVKAVNPRTKIVYLANPNNPTGTIFSKSEFEWLMSQISPNILVILDEAYFQYVGSGADYPNGLEYDLENLIVTRTFSKAYGLGGVRVGFAAGPEKLISALQKVKLPFEPNHLAQVAAVAALGDLDFLNKTIDVNARSIARFEAKFDELGIKHVPTYANSILMVFPTEQIAEQLFLRCLDLGLILRHVKSFGIPEGVRINSGSEEDTTFALEVIGKVYPQLRREFIETAKINHKGIATNEACVVPHKE